MNYKITQTKEVYLTERGWHTYYNDNYWVNLKLVADPERQDYTDYGMDLESAYFHEMHKLGPFEPLLGLPNANMILKAKDWMTQIKKHFEGLENNQPTGTKGG